MFYLTMHSTHFIYSYNNNDNDDDVFWMAKILKIINKQIKENK